MSKFGFLTVICIVLGLTVTSAVAFKPVPIGSGIGNETIYVGP